MLVNHRNAQAIPIEDADSFFHTVQQQVESIEEFSRPHPLSTEAAVSSLKRFLSEPRHRIQLSDLVNDAVEQVVQLTSGEDFDFRGPAPTTETVTSRVRAYEAANSTLLSMAIVGGFWAEEAHTLLWQRALQRLGSDRWEGSRMPLWPELHRYPATLLLYALGLGAVEAGRFQFLERILTSRLSTENQENLMALLRLSPCAMFSGYTRKGGHAMRLLEGMEKRKVPLNDWIQDTLRPHSKRILPDDEHYTLVFDKLEILIALSYAYHNGDRSRMLPGAFAFRYGETHPVVQEIRESLGTEGAESPFVRCDIFGKSVDHCAQALGDLEDFRAKMRWNQLWS